MTLPGVAGFTTQAWQDIFGHALLGQVWTPPAHYYLGLFITAPSDDSGAATGAVEPAGSVGFARVQLTAAMLDWDSNLNLANVLELAFPVATADYPDTIKAAGMWTAASGGLLWMWGFLTDPGTGSPAPQNIVDGQVPRIAAGALHLNRLAA